MFLNQLEAFNKHFHIVTLRTTGIQLVYIPIILILYANNKCVIIIKCEQYFLLTCIIVVAKLR